MTTVQPHLKIAWGGSIGSPALEVWTNSIAWMTKTGGDWASVVELGLAGTQAQMSKLSTAIGQWFQTAADPAGDPTTGKGSGCSKEAKLEWVKLNLIGADGKYMFASNTFFYPAAIPGGGTLVPGAGPYAPPWQATTAITLRTTVARGRGSKGRIYPPLSGGLSANNDSPYIDPNTSVQMRNGFVGLLNNFNSGLYFDSSQGNGYYPGLGVGVSRPGNCCIVSTTPTSGPHAGAAPLLTPIASVEVDEVMDVQTRRVNRVPRRISGTGLVTLNL